MNLFRDFRDYMLEEQFKIVYFPNKVDIVNYEDITHFDSNKIIIKYAKGSVSVIGNHLIVTKLLQDELLIEGEVLKIELG